ncbi:hypothetical protein L9F63_007808, partial [Diploptera punctata]
VDLYEEIIEKSEANIIQSDLNVPYIGEGTSSGNTSNFDGLFSPRESSDTDFTCNISLDDCDLTRPVSKHLKLSVCKNSLAKSINLRKSLRMHSTEKPFRCRICNKSFTRNYSLTIHLRSHSDEKPFKCHICNKSFTRNYSLNIHLRLHSNAKLLNCSCV